MLFLMELVITLLLLTTINTASSQPQINLLNQGCSTYNATNLSRFFGNLNGTMSDLRGQLLNENRHFATAQQARSSDPVYGMVQCRNYLSIRDCVACFDAAVSLIRNCSAANGARVIYDGCFLRYESNSFYDQTTLPGNVGLCGNRTVSQATNFDTAVNGLLGDLQIATPKISGFFATSTRQIAGSTVGAVYAIAQCAETLSKAGCLDCLTVAYSNLKTCPPEADGRAVDAGCFLRYSDTAFFPDNQTTNITPFLKSGSSSNKKAIIIGSIAGGVGLVLIVILLLWYKILSNKKAAQRGNMPGATELQGPATYSYKDLKLATKDFSEETKLGKGGYGDVYKGTLKNGDIVAVKKLALDSSIAEATFESEVRLISNVHHRNLIRLLGCCTKGPFLLLVIEYMVNSSLDKFLYGEKRGTLNWKQRFGIIFGTARGLAYLHEQFHPKIADFGLARLLPENQSHVSTKFAGTLGYTAPEYAIHGQLSEKVDTYSFGIVVLEIISGRRCNDVEATNEYLLEDAWRMYENNMHLDLIDETLDPNEYRAEDVKKCIEIGLLCTQSPVSSRPTMSEVLVMLLSDPSEQPRLPNRSMPMELYKKAPEDSSISTGSSTATATTTSTFTGR
ncbi:putative cysteine-rich receptor-like protein kinase 3-like [Heracleum sosnowskyi]|uniref:Cysteine-rich receptor-like protein kinase 3-like n=1 Tax=Heracleum sosnowskyi TaxID=360622 RepID=A0AAD8M5U2_9APIA|nr:putative cysteine-rich receptor-like protein kinase 3-like [Heracleum sosnowskyi]